VHTRPASGGGRWIIVEPERLAGWLERFAAAHGDTACEVDPTVVTFAATDGAVADCQVPFPPLTGQDLVSHALIPRRIGVLLVRLGGYAAGIFEGTRLVASKVGSRQVQGRTAAGGWSQQRFARRREGQAQAAFAAAADTAVRILVPEAATLDAVVLGGDKRATSAVMTDPRLAALVPLVRDPHLEVPDPRLRVLEETPRQFRSVRIRVR
jgi:hypothetical protein